MKISGKKLKEILKRKGMTQSALAREVDVTPATVTNWVQKEVPEYRVGEIARVLGLRDRNRNLKESGDTREDDAGEEKDDLIGGLDEHEIPLDDKVKKHLDGKSGIYSLVGREADALPRSGSGMSDPNFANRTLFHGDNLPVLRGMNSGCVDLIATDPPFNKGRDFHATPNSLAAGASFQDRWSWERDVHQEWVDRITDDHPRLMEAIESARYAHSDGMGAFMCFMAVRLLEMRRVLKPTGSIYLHCDPTASHYLKAVMDAVFGWRNFRNDLIWRYGGGARGAKAIARHFAKNHDNLLYYAKDRAAAVHNPIHSGRKWPVSDLPSHIRSGGGRYFKTAPRGDYTDESVERLRREGRIHETRTGKIRIKYFLEREGQFVIEPILAGSVWDIPDMMHSSPDERQGFPTQKPLALYERMIRASSNEGGIVLDPFAGCATTLVAAERLGRQWVGSDIWDNAPAVVLARMKQERLVLPEAERGDLFTHDINFTTAAPVRTDDGGEAAPFLRTRVKVSEPHGPKMSRVEMYRFLLGQHGSRCQGCDRAFDDPRHLELDHNTPRSDGGLNHISNRILLCGPCNRLKSNTLTLSGLRRENGKRGYMAGRDGEHPLMREIREERENAPPTPFD